MDRSLKYTYAVCVSLVVIIIAIYAQVYAYDFVNFDDGMYVRNNEHVKQGLTLSNVAWAFTTGDTGNWHPLTWLSYMLDVQLFGVNPGAMHLVNVFFHALNAVLLFLLLRNMTKALWPSALVAALFAVHPLHVESVAWISERKDVLSTFFWLLTTAAYVAYVRRPGVLWYLLILISIALGLMAKSMLVTLPAVFLLLDYWPLGRLIEGASLPHSLTASQPHCGGKSKKKKNRDKTAGPAMNERKMQPSVIRCVLEKLPLFALTVASSVITFLVQGGGNNVASLNNIPVKLRIGNALLSYGRYLWMTVFPRDLTVFYPHLFFDLAIGQDFFRGLALGQVILSCLLLVCISAGAILAARRYPFFIVGWLWYLGTLVPVIGIIQVGMQALADRYTYIPLMGIFIMVAWGGAEVVMRWRIPKGAVAVLVGAVLAVFSVLAFVQVRCWSDSVALFTHAIAASNSYVAHFKLGEVFLANKKFEDAVGHYQQGFAFNPRRINYQQYKNMSIALENLGRFDEAKASYQKALEIFSQDANVHCDYGNLLKKMNRTGGGRNPAVDEAAAEYKKALENDPPSPLAGFYLANMLGEQGKDEEAVRYFRQLLEKKPDHLGAYVNLGNIFMHLGRAADANAQYLEVVKRDPESRNPESRGIYINLGNASAQQEKFDDAVKYYLKAIQLDPKQANVCCSLGVTLRKQGKLREAADVFSETLRLDPGNALATESLAQIQAKLNRGS